MWTVLLPCKYQTIKRRVLDSRRRRRRISGGFLYRAAGRGVAAGIAQPCLNLGDRLIGLEGLAGGISVTGDSVAAAGVSTSNTALQPSLSESRRCSLHAGVRAPSGISELQSRIASPEHICSCSSV